MQRKVEPELLDSLPPDDPRAIRSRRDLQRINTFMRNSRMLAGLIGSQRVKNPVHIVEIGCGDGRLILQIAQRLRWPGVRLTLLDMAPVVSTSTLAAFRALDWEPTVLQCWVQDWLCSGERADLVLANLFLHHFEDAQLAQLFAGLQKVTPAFVSCEPRRWVPALFCTRLLWAIACNDVTRHDARVSVRAGFRDNELSRLWDNKESFELFEKPGGYASHLFCAKWKT